MCSLLLLMLLGWRRCLCCCWLHRRSLAHSRVSEPPPMKQQMMGVRDSRSDLVAAGALLHQMGCCCWHQMGSHFRDKEHDRLDGPEYGRAAEDDEVVSTLAGRLRQSVTAHGRGEAFAMGCVGDPSSILPGKGPEATRHPHLGQQQTLLTERRGCRGLALSLHQSEMLQQHPAGCRQALLLPVAATIPARSWKLSGS